jgi:hypothetical protein
VQLFALSDVRPISPYTPVSEQNMSSLDYGLHIYIASQWDKYLLLSGLSPCGVVRSLIDFGVFSSVEVEGFKAIGFVDSKD